jgi:hypothetical protein
VTGWDISITMTQQPEEIGTAGIDLIQADVQGTAAFRLLLGDTLAEVNINQLDMPFSAALL